MINIGRFNILKVNRFVDFGAYLDAGDDKEILLPLKYFDATLKVGDEIEVFVYNDSEDRLIATTERPFAMVGEFAYLQVVQTNSVGAFLDWGITAKYLLVPFREHKVDMKQGGIYLVYVYLDDTTKRIVASAKIDKFIGNVLPHYKKGDKVKALVYNHTPLGYKCIVDNLFHGMIYQNETYKPIELEEVIEAYVKNVREDGKIDLTISDRARARTGELSDQILAALKALPSGCMMVSDKSSPETIKEIFQCSKKDFKKAIGKLYKAHLIEIGDDRITLL